jgi:hypothetical protein
VSIPTNYFSQKNKIPHLNIAVPFEGFVPCFSNSTPFAPKNTAREDPAPAAREHEYCCLNLDLQICFEN